MTEILVCLLVAAAYALGRARDERDRLLRLLQERRAGRRPQRLHWHPVEELLAAERLIWRQTAAVHHAARQAMHDVVATVADHKRPTKTSPSAATRRTSSRKFSRG